MTAPTVAARVEDLQYQRVTSMARSSTVQIAIKPQDLYVLFALLTRKNGEPTYAQLGVQTGLAPSAVHASMKRAV